MKKKILYLSLLLMLLLVPGCSNEDTQGCAKMKEVSFDQGPTYISLYMIPASGVNSFRIEYGRSGFVPGTGSKIITSDSQIQIQNLTPSTTYDLYITGICEAGELSAAYKISNVTTSQSQCTGTTSAEIFQYTPGTVELYLSYDNGYPDRYEVEYGLQGFTQGTGTKKMTEFSAYSMSISGLQNETAYDFYVRSYCWSQDMSSFRKYTYTTIGSCPAPVNLNSYLISGNCNAGTATRGFTWSYPAGAAQSYTISVLTTIDGQPEDGNQFTTSNSSIALGNMFCIWKAFYVKANCTGGDSSAWAGPFIF
jgi:hypothetical protein